MNNKKKAFISGCSSIGKCNKSTVANILKVRDIIPYFYYRGISNTSYDINMVRKADVFILMTANNSFGNIILDNLPNGVKKELQLAIDNKIPIYLAYKSQFKGYQIYKTTFNVSYTYGTIISGVQGSYNDIYEDIYDIDNDPDTPTAEELERDLKKDDVNLNLLL